MSAFPPDVGTRPIVDMGARWHLALMSKRDSERLRKLLTQNRLKKRASALMGQWASRGVSVSPVAHDRYWLLLDKLRGGRSWPLNWTGDLLAELRTFSAGSDMLTILGWNVNDEPALLISAEKLTANAPVLNHLYPDGFVLISDLDRKALLVDFDDEAGTHINSIDLPTPAV
jgi:hypothetical protein